MKSRHSRKLIPLEFLKTMNFEKAGTENGFFLVNNTENSSLIQFLLVEITKIRGKPSPNIIKFTNSRNLIPAKCPKPSFAKINSFNVANKCLDTFAIMHIILICSHFLKIRFHKRIVTALYRAYRLWGPPLEPVKGTITGLISKKATEQTYSIQ